MKTKKQISAPKASKAKKTIAQAPVAPQQAATPAPAAVQPAPAQRAPRAASAAPAPKAPREERNGVKRPKDGGLCAAVWSYLDQHGNMSAADLRPVAEVKGWNINNASIELYGWRKFNGLGRVERVAADPKPVNKKEAKGTRAKNQEPEAAAAAGGTTGVKEAS